MEFTITGGKDISRFSLHPEQEVLKIIIPFLNPIITYWGTLPLMITGKR